MPLNIANIIWTLTGALVALRKGHLCNSSADIRLVQEFSRILLCDQLWL